MSKRDIKDDPSSLGSTAQFGLRRTLSWLLAMICFLAVVGLLVIAINDTQTLAGAANDSDNQSIADSSSKTALDTTINPITIVQTATSLQAESSNQILSDWQYVGPHTFNSCQSSLFTSLADKVKSGGLVYLQSADYGKKYCFRAKAQQIYFYKNYQVKHLAPMINFDQISQKNALGIQAFSNQTVVKWQWLADLDEAECDGGVFNNADQSLIRQTKKAVLQVIPVRLNSYYCLRVQNQADVWGYKLLQLTPANINPLDVTP